MMNSVQKLETVGIDYSTADIFRLIESGWNVSYSKSTMSAFRTVPQHENEEELQKEEKE
jgi:hypothetical protein